MRAMWADPGDEGRRGIGSHRAGLTLVEILFAVGILSVVFTAFLTSFTIARRTAAMARNQVNGVAAARQKMEELRLCSFNSAELAPGVHALSNGQYVVSLESGNPAIKVIDLTVLWCEPLSRITSSVSLNTTMTTSLHE